MRSRLAVMPALVVLVTTAVVGCADDSDAGEHTREIEEWRKARLARLTREDGWLTLIGLAWLEEGTNTSGGAPDNRIRIESDRAPAVLGTFTRHGDSVEFTAAPGVEVSAGDSAITTLALRDDHHPEGPTILRHATLWLYVIKRGDQLGIRIKDSMSRTRTEFAGLEYFPTDLKWRVLAHYTAFGTPKTMETPSLTGPPQELVFAGILRFSIDGQDLSLLASIEGDELFLMFGDETNGIETYGAGRQLYTPLPDEGTVIVDFNKAYNWPCVFTEFATCPLPPKENILPIRVEAGEQARGH
jgi:uncharacterized protein (DUF1684 family)